MKYPIELSIEQAEMVTREYLIDLLGDVNVPFTDPKLTESLNFLIAYMSVPGEWEEGRYDS